MSFVQPLLNTDQNSPLFPSLQPQKRNLDKQTVTPLLRTLDELTLDVVFEFHLDSLVSIKLNFKHCTTLRHHT